MARVYERPTLQEVAGLTREANRMVERGSDVTAAELDDFMRRKAEILIRIAVDPPPVDSPETEEMHDMLRLEVEALRASLHARGIDV